MACRWQVIGRARVQSVAGLANRQMRRRARRRRGLKAPETARAPLARRAATRRMTRCVRRCNVLAPFSATPGSRNETPLHVPALNALGAVAKPVGRSGGRAVGARQHRRRPWQQDSSPGELQPSTDPWAMHLRPLCRGGTHPRVVKTLRPNRSADRHQTCNWPSARLRPPVVMIVSGSPAPTARRFLAPDPNVGGTVRRINSLPAATAARLPAAGP